MGELINGRTPEEIDANALLDDLQELLNQEVIGNTVSDVGNGIALSMQRVMEAKETTLNALRDEVYQDAVAHGLWESTDYTVQCCIGDCLQNGDPFDPDTLMRDRATQVIIMEMYELNRASEDAEAYTEELADVIIAALSVAGKLGIDIDAAVKRKMEVNKRRPWKHGKEEKTC